MSASNNLSKQLFHGTHVEFKPGDIVKPSKKTGVESNWPSISKKKYAYATESQDWAKSFAEMSASSDPTNRVARVYEVEPLGRTRGKNIVHKSRRGDVPAMIEHRSRRGFKVVREVK